jgi:hypothetical protein
MSSIIYNLNGNDKTLILDTRASLLQGFVATLSRLRLHSWVLEKYG